MVDDPHSWGTVGASQSIRIAVVLIATLCAFSVAPLRAFAMDSTELLPESVNSPSVRMGVVSGLGMRFLGNGDLMTLSDIHSIEFDTKTLVAFEPQVKELVTVLNQFGDQKLGDQLSLGTLHVNTEPEVRYIAPILARGITARWTVALGFPVITYKNRISLTASGSNVGEMRKAVGNGAVELNRAFDRLNVNLATSAQEVLAKKGYRTLGDRDETQLGDIQVASLMDVGKTENISAQLRTVVSLPTGKGNDPDDLADLGAFGYTSIENILVGNLVLSGRWRLAAKTGYRYTLPDSVVRRVPADEDDTLPGMESREGVERRTGGAYFVGTSATYSILESLTAGAGYEIARREADVYSGTGTRRYDLLGKDTRAGSDRIRLGLTYSSVELFMADRAWLPTILAYEFSDTVSGFNTERMTVHEVWLQLFF